jgi:hypothetical protein
MSGGYPSLADLLAYLEDRAIEFVPQGETDYMVDFLRTLYGLINAFDWSGALGVYAASAITFNVRGGSYLDGNSVKTFTPDAAIDPADNDTTYIWLDKSFVSLGHDIDGNGWPEGEIIKLAEIDVDADGVITAIRDLRGQTFLRCFGDLPETDIVGLNDAQEITAKTIDGDLNTVQNITAAALKALTGNMAIPFVLTTQLTAGNTVQIYNANSPFKFRIIDAHSIAKSADGGTWKLTDGTNDITDAVTVTGTDKTKNQVGTIDDAYYEIAANGSLSVVGDGSLADVMVHITAIRIP